MRLHNVDIPEDKVAELCRRYGASRLSLFGSILTDDFGPESDVDMLVEFPASAEVSLFDLGGMLMDIREVIPREVHLMTPLMLPPSSRPAVRAVARVLYAA